MPHSETSGRSTFSILYALCTGGGVGEGEKVTQVWQEGKSRVQVGMGSSNRACLCRYPESSPKSRHEKAVGVSAAQSWHFSGAGEAKGWPRISRDPVKRRGRADAPRNRELDLRRRCGSEKELAELPCWGRVGLTQPAQG